MLAIALVGALALAGCAADETPNKDDPNVTYNLIVSKTGAGIGTVTSNPSGIDCGNDCAESYDDGALVTVTATADTESQFDGWGGDCSGTGTCTVSMNFNKNVTVAFSPVEGIDYTLTVSKTGSGSGTVTSIPVGVDCGADCTEAYEEETSVTLTAIVDTNSTFGGWSGCFSVSSNICTVTMDSDRFVTATFSPEGVIEYTLDVSKTGSGSGTITSIPVGIDCGADCTEAYEEGTTVTLTAIEDTGSTFAGWSGCDSTAVSPDRCFVAMTAGRSVTATFTLRTPDLTVSAAGTGGGTVSRSPSGTSCGTDCWEYNYGIFVTLTASPDTGSDFTGWSGCDSMAVSPDRCFVTMTSARTVTASFDSTSPVCNFGSDFSQDPGFVTTDSTDFYWNQAAETYHFRYVDSENDVAYKNITYNGESYTLSVDFKLDEVTWSGALELGLFGDTQLGSSNGGMMTAGFNDGGLHFSLSFPGIGDIVFYNYSLNVWYSAILSYDAVTNIGTLDIQERSSGTVVAALTATGIPSLQNITRLGIGKIDGDGSGRGIGEIDNLCFVY